MKTTIRITSIVIMAMLMLTASCKKPKKEPDPQPSPTPLPNEEEVITTFKLILTDSAANTTATYMFKDPDGDGGQPAFYGPASTTQSDSVFTLSANSTYYGEIVLLDETKSPADSISGEVEEEGDEHMLFYNNGSNTILNSGNNPYTVQMPGSEIKITYTDLDGGAPQRGIGIKTRWRTYGAKGSSKFPLNISLRHQPGKDGTYAPGETDISVDFKVKVN